MLMKFQNVSLKMCILRTNVFIEDLYKSSNTFVSRYKLNRANNFKDYSGREIGALSDYLTDRMVDIVA